MREESISDNQNDTSSLADTTHTDNTGTTTLTLGKVPYNKRVQNTELDVLPELPSHKFKFSVWHDLRETCLTGDQLHAPRVRQGPQEAKKDFYRLEEEGVPIHHALYGTKRQNYRNQFENWEGAKYINLSYQELSDEYQLKNFYRILARCQSAITVNLVDNELETLKKVTFPSCEYLNVDRNYMRSFHNLPMVPKAKCISATWNAITALKGLDRFASSAVTELSLQGNPVAFHLNYRQQVFSILPHLRILDGIPRSPSDSVFEDTNMPGAPQSGCTIL